MSQRIRQYSLENLPNHLVGAGQYQKFFALLENPKWYEKRRDYFVQNGGKPFEDDVILAIETAQRMSLGLNYTIPYQLLLITLRTLIATIPSEMFQQMLEDQQDELLVEYYARNIANPLLKVDVLKGLYRKYFLKNQNERASSFLQEALNSAEAIRGGKRRMETFTKLAELASQLGDNYQARSIRTLLRFT